MKLAIIVIFILILMYLYHCNSIIETHENKYNTCSSDLTVLSDMNDSIRQKIDRIIYELHDTINNGLDISTLNSLIRNEVIKANIAISRLNKKNMTTKDGEYIDDVKELLQKLDKEVEEEYLETLDDEQKEDYIQEMEIMNDAEDKYLDGARLITVPKERLFLKYQKCLNNPKLKETEESLEKIKELMKEKKEIQEEIHSINKQYSQLQKEFNFLEENHEKIRATDIQKLTNKYNTLLDLIEGDDINNKLLKLKDMIQKATKYDENQQSMPSQMYQKQYPKPPSKQYPKQSRRMRRPSIRRGMTRKRKTPSRGRRRRRRR